MDFPKPLEQPCHAVTTKLQAWMMEFRKSRSHAGTKLSSRKRTHLPGPLLQNNKKKVGT